MATNLSNPISNIAPSQLNGGQSGSAPAYACRAWVNFNGSGTVSIRGSGNVSSVTDNGTGNYTVNFTTPMPNANYAVAASGAFDNATDNGSSTTPITSNNLTTTSFRMRLAGGTNNLLDGSNIYAVVVG